VLEVLGKGLQWCCDSPVDIAVLTTRAEAWLLILTQLIIRFSFRIRFYRADITLQRNQEVANRCS